MDSAERKKSTKHWFYGDNVVELAERNSDEFPLGLLARSIPKGLKRLEFADQITDSSTGEQVERNLVISANVDTDLPNYWDIDVQKALVAITHRRNRFEFQERVEFTIYEVLKEMKLPNATKNIRRIAKSLDNWNGVRFKYSHWWTGDAWDHPRAFVLLQDYDLSRRGKGARAPATPQVFTWSRHFVESIRNSPYKPFDSDFYFSLKTPKSRRMFAFLDKRLSGSPWYRKSLEEFAKEKMGLTRNRRLSQYPDMLRDPYDELVGTGFLARLPDERRFLTGSGGEPQFYCKRGRGKKSRSRVAVPLELVVDNENASGLEKELLRRGVEPGRGKTQAEGMAAKHDEQLIRTNCERYDVLLELDSEVTPGLLVHCIAGGKLLRLPKGVETPSEKQGRAELRQRRDQAKSSLDEAMAVYDELKRAVPLEAFDSLEAGLRAVVLTEAIEAGTPFAKSQFEQSVPGSPSWLEARNELLRKQFRFIHRRVNGGGTVTAPSLGWYEAVSLAMKPLKSSDEWQACADAKRSFDKATSAYEAAMP